MVTMNVRVESSAPPLPRSNASVAVPRASSRRRALLVVGWLAFALIAVVLATYHLDRYPTTWFDEGSHLHVPKDLIQFGVYADRSSDGFHYFGPTIGVGPTVMLPIALAFRLAGIGLLQARLVIVLYMLASIALLGLLAGRRYGWAAAFVAATLLVVTPGVDFLTTGREVLGEVPAFAFLLVGIYFWWRSLEARREIATILGAGLGFGLAALTKNQFGLVLVPTFVLLYLVDRLYYRQLRLRHVAIPLLMVGGFWGAGYLVLLPLLIQSRNLTEFIALFRSASGGAIFVFSPSRILSSLKFLLGPDDFAFWGIPALIYGLALARERSRAGLQQAFVLAFIVVGLGWYVFASIGWPRYAFAPLALTTVFVAKLLVDLIRELARTDGPQATLNGSRVSIAAVAAALALVVFCGSSLVGRAEAIATANGRGPQQMAAYLDANVPRSDVIETWEPELGFLSDDTFHYPPDGWLDRAVRAKWLGADNLRGGYDPIGIANPKYLIVGPFAKYTGIYNPVLARLEPRLVVSEGDYDLYQVR
jgi:4-amino-4-deoxy-L-arabinose transferase-like glycosyltransferase